MAKDSPSVFGYVYLVRNRKNGKIYIGQTTQSISIRWTQHCSVSKNRCKSSLHNAIQKYGRDSFDVVEIGRASSKEELDEMECRSIWTHQSNNRKIGYNLTSGGEGVVGLMATEETKRKVSEASKATWRKPGFREAMKATRDRVFSTPEHSARKSEAAQRYCRSDAYKAKHRDNTTALWKDPEYRRKQAEGMTKAVDAACRQKHRDSINERRESEPGFEDKRLAGVSAMWSDPIRRAALLEKRRITNELRKSQSPRIEGFPVDRRVTS